MKHLKGKVCLVTGGTRGIGRAIALGLADAGADVAFNYVTAQSQAEEVCSLIHEKGVRATAFQANVASTEQVHSLVTHITNELGPISILVNNAGITRDKTFLKMTKEMWDDVLRVNLDGLFNTTHEVAPMMIQAGWGRIVNISSIVGLTGNFGQANYATTKGGIISFTMTLAREFGRRGVTVNVVAPGFIETDMTKEVPPSVIEQVKAVTPIGRLGKPEEVADAVVFLASNKANFITGQVLSVNGGMYM